VLAFEPGPPYLQKLRVNLELNPALKKVVTVENMGLSDKDGSLFWMADPSHPYNAGLMATDGVSVPVATIDGYVRERDLQTLDFIKIDVESMELEVLRGSREALARFRPVVLFETMEWAREARGFDIFKEIEEMLSRLDYGIHDLTADGTLLEVSSRSLPLNTLAIPRSLNPA
jgi:FkbM family methyltransferase